MRKFNLSAASLLVVGSTSIFAADETAAPVIVTATRTAQSADATLASVTVITRADLERTQVLSVQDALRDVPGINIDNNGGLGKYTSIFMRGTNPGHVLILVDGIKVGSATAGTTPIQDIPIDQIERIEIVRGPLSSLYGSEALGGVIQIFTRKGQDQVTPSFSAGAGSNHTYKLEAGVSGAIDDSWFNANLSNLDSIGFNACSGAPYISEESQGGGCNTYEPDVDGYKRHSATMRAGHRFADGTNLEATALRTQGKNQYDGVGQNEGDFVQQVFSGKLQFSPAEIWHTTLVAGRSWDNTKNYLNGDYVSKFDTRRDTVSLQNDIATSEKQVTTLGLDYQDDSLESNTLYTVTSRDNKGLFAQYQTILSGHSLALSARRDHNEQFKGHNTGNLMWGYDIIAGMRVKASYGTAFKAPSFNDLYYPIYGNPSVAPEKSRSTEIGLEAKTSWGRWSTNVFQTNVTNLIVFRGPSYIADNIDTVRIRGLEASISATVEQWHIAANGTLINPEDRSPGVNHGELLARRTRQIANIDLGRRFGIVNVATSMHAEGKRYDYFDPAVKDRLGGFATIDLRVELPIAPEWMLQARASNLLDKRYETAHYYNQDGRNYFLTLRYQPSLK
ncbi:MAG: TonB-dependent vitamin B12 receptor [Gammaproteobacteria bacterium]|nr:TonB-dependent vitamin B12 receptor [Gammaproteobacteria bacterium]